jgi:hypothetical protein
MGQCVVRKGLRLNEAQRDCQCACTVYEVAQALLLLLLCIRAAAAAANRQQAG